MKYFFQKTLQEFCRFRARARAQHRGEGICAADADPEVCDPHRAGKARSYQKFLKQIFMDSVIFFKKRLIIDTKSKKKKVCFQTLIWLRVPRR